MIPEDRFLNITKYSNMPNHPVLEIGKEDSFNKGFIGRIMDIDPFTGLVTVTADSKTYYNVKVLQPVSSGNKGFSLPMVNNTMDLLEEPVLAHIIMINGAPYVSSLVPLSFNGEQPVSDEFKKTYKARTGKDYVGNEFVYKFDPSKEDNKLPERFEPVLSAENPTPNAYKDLAKVSKLAKVVRDSYYIAIDRATAEETYRMLKENDAAGLAKLNKAIGSDTELSDFAVDHDNMANKRQICWMGDSALYRSRAGSKIMGIDDGRVAMIGGTYCHSTWSKDHSLSEVVALHKYRNLGGQYEWGAKVEANNYESDESNFKMELWSHRNNQNSFYDNIKAVINFGRELSRIVSNAGASNEKITKGVFELSFHKAVPPLPQSKQTIALKKDFLGPFQSVTSIPGGDLKLLDTSKDKMKSFVSLIVDDSGAVNLACDGKVIISTPEDIDLKSSKNINIIASGDLTLSDKSGTKKLVNK